MSSPRVSGAREKPGSEAEPTLVWTVLRCQPVTKAPLQSTGAALGQDTGVSGDTFTGRGSGTDGHVRPVAGSWLF